MNLGRLNVTKRNWSFFLFVNFFSVHSDLHQVTAFSCGFVHCSVFDTCSECCLLHFEKNACFVLCYLQMNLTENKQLLGSTMTPSLLHWEQELFPWELFHASLPTQRGTCSGFPVPHCPAPSCHQESGRLQPRGFYPQLGKAFSICVKGGEVAKHG